jgi:hypothetical protein
MNASDGTGWGSSEARRTGIDNKLVQLGAILGCESIRLVMGKNKIHQYVTIPSR